MLTPQIENKIKILVESLGFRLFDIVSVKENENRILRISITKENGKITLEDCQEVSLAASPLLDVEMPESKNYFLEVSSPGIERVLKHLEHFRGAVNELVKIKTLDKKEFKGKLIKADENALTLDSGIAILLKDIKKAQTYFEW